MKVKSEMEVAQSCLTLSNPMDCSLPGSSIHGIFQARVLEWDAIAFSEGTSRALKFELPREQRKALQTEGTAWAKSQRQESMGCGVEVDLQAVYSGWSVGSKGTEGRGIQGNEDQLRSGKDLKTTLRNLTLI